MDPTLIKSIESVIQTVGFPATVAFWFMFRMEKRLDEQTKVMQEIADSLRHHLESTSETN